MPLFTFEALLTDGANIVADTRDLPSSAEAWGPLEVLAIQLRQRKEVLLRVKDKDGLNVILTRVANAIVSIERCRKTTCPIKDLLAVRGGEQLDACAPSKSIPVSEIPSPDLPDSLLSPARLLAG